MKGGDVKSISEALGLFDFQYEDVKYLVDRKGKLIANEMG